MWRVLNTSILSILYSFSGSVYDAFHFTDLPLLSPPPRDSRIPGVLSRFTNMLRILGLMVFVHIPSLLMYSNKGSHSFHTSAPTSTIISFLYIISFRPFIHSRSYHVLDSHSKLRAIENEFLFCSSVKFLFNYVSRGSLCFLH